MCPVDAVCLTVWMFDSTVISLCLLAVAGVVIFKLIKTIIDAIPVV